MNLVTPEFTPSTGFSTSECKTCLWGSLTSPSGDDQEPPKLSVKFLILEARQAHYTKLMRNLKKMKDSYTPCGEMASVNDEP
ncbi:hypothetical protein BYT27DRAFT_7263735 [Phlegmacium glaucopus]|nr:hypothetical protein BYT27DRAFT_7263735 [Phlegmacium glaucopus]